MTTDFLLELIPMLNARNMGYMITRHENKEATVQLMSFQSLEDIYDIKQHMDLHVSWRISSGWKLERREPIPAETNQL